MDNRNIINFELLILDNIFKINTSRLIWNSKYVFGIFFYYMESKLIVTYDVASSFSFYWNHLSHLTLESLWNYLIALKQGNISIIRDICTYGQYKWSCQANGRSNGGNFSLILNEYYILYICKCLGSLKHGLNIHYVFI